MAEKILPISEPLLSAYPEVGQAFSIIDYSDSKSLDWMYSNFVQLYVHHKWRTTYVESIPIVLAGKYEQCGEDKKLSLVHGGKVCCMRISKCRYEKSVSKGMGMSYLRDKT